MSQEPAIAQRIVRAKQRVQELGLRYELPGPQDLPARLSSVLDVLYLLFNEGYSAHDGDALLKKDICLEALRSARALTMHEPCALPEVHALCALMAFHASRLDARTDPAGDLLLLKDQDRTQWDPALIQVGVEDLLAAAQGDVLTTRHVEAGIAACHALAPTYEATDWRRIVDYYDTLLQLNASPVVALNRAAAVAMADGPEAGLKALAPLRREPRLKDYFLLHGVEGELNRMLGRRDPARRAFQRALSCPLNAPERRFIQKRLTDLT